VTCCITKTPSRMGHSTPPTTCVLIELYDIALLNDSYTLPPRL